MCRGCRELDATAIAAVVGKRPNTTLYLDLGFVPCARFLLATKQGNGVTETHVFCQGGLSQSQLGDVGLSDQAKQQLGAPRLLAKRVELT